MLRSLCVSPHDRYADAVGTIYTPIASQIGIQVPIVN
jgi:hypothetical protein